MGTKSASAPLKYLIVCANDTLIPEAELTKLSPTEQKLIQASIYIGKLERLRSVKKIINDKHKTWNIKEALCIAAGIAPKYIKPEPRDIPMGKFKGETIEIQNIVWTGGQHIDMRLGTPTDKYVPLLKNAEVWGCTSGAFRYTPLHLIPEREALGNESAHKNLIEWTDRERHPHNIEPLKYYATTGGGYDNSVQQGQKTKLLEHAQEQIQSIFTAHAGDKPQEYQNGLDEPISRQDLVQFLAKTAYKLNGIPAWLDDYKNRRGIIQWLYKNRTMFYIADWLNYHQNRPESEDFFRHGIGKSMIINEQLFADERRAIPEQAKAAATANAQRMCECYKQNIPLLEEVLVELRKPQVFTQLTTVKSWWTKNWKWLIGIIIAIVGTILN